MFDKLKLSNVEFFNNLSEEEQEIISGGQDVNNSNEIDFFLQTNNIETEGENSLTLANNDFSVQKTKYDASQITIGFSLKYETRISTSIGNSLNNFITNLMNKLF